MCRSTTVKLGMAKKFSTIKLVLLRFSLLFVAFVVGQEASAQNISKKIQLNSSYATPTGNDELTFAASSLYDNSLQLQVCTKHSILCGALGLNLIYLDFVTALSDSGTTQAYRLNQLGGGSNVAIDTFPLEWIVTKNQLWFSPFLSSHFAYGYLSSNSSKQSRNLKLTHSLVGNYSKYGFYSGVKIGYGQRVSLSAFFGKETVKQHFESVSLLFAATAFGGGLNIEL